MANRYRIAAGLWSSAAGWDGGVSVPAIGDNCYSNNFACTIDVDVTVVLVSNAAQSPAVGGGGFTLNDGITLTANVSGGSATASGVVTYSGASPNVATIIGNVTGGLVGSNHGARNTSTGRLNITGNVSGNAGNVAHGVSNQSSGYVVITGNVVGGAVNGVSFGVVNASTGRVDISGTVSGGTVNTACNGVYNATTGRIDIGGAVIPNSVAVPILFGGAGTLNLAAGIPSYNTNVGAVSMGAGGTLNITGNVFGPTISGNNCITYAGSGSITINGNLTGGTGTTALSVGAGAPTVTITGNVTGGATSSNAFGINILASCSGTFNITGNVTGGSFNNTHGISCSSNPTVTINGNIYGSPNNGVTASHGLCTLAGTGGGAWTVNGDVLGDYSPAISFVVGNNCSLTVNGNVHSGTVIGHTGGGITHVATAAPASLTVNATTIKGLYGYAIACSTPVANITASGGIESLISAAMSFGHISGTINVIGNYTVLATGGLGISASHVSPAVLNIIGNITMNGAQSGGIQNNTTGTVNITGNVINNSTASNVHGANNVLGGTLNITGNVYASNVALSTATGATNSALGTLNVYGTAFPSTSANSSNHGVNNANVGPCFVQVSQGHNYPNGGILTSNVFGTNQATLGGAITVDALIFGSGGYPPFSGRHFIRDAGTNYTQMRQSNNGVITTMGEVSADYPAVSNVRDGVVYNFGALTGTLKVPPAGSVVLGVPVDNTVGTAGLSPTALLGVDLRARLEQCATVDSTGSQVIALG